jgi:putative transposase
MFKHPWLFLLMLLSGWINRYQEEMMTYLKEENKILKEKIGKKRIILNDDQRRRLAIKGKKLGRKLLSACSPNIYGYVKLCLHHSLKS